MQLLSPLTVADKPLTFNEKTLLQAELIGAVLRSQHLQRGGCGRNFQFRAFSGFLDEFVSGGLMPQPPDPGH